MLLRPGTVIYYAWTIMQVIHSYALGSRAKFRLGLSGQDVEVIISRVCLDREHDMLYVVQQKGNKRKWTALPSDLRPTDESKFATIVMEEQASLRTRGNNGPTNLQSDEEQISKLALKGSTKAAV
jgi:hypothetical protein